MRLSLFPHWESFTNQTHLQLHYIFFLSSTISPSFLFIGKLYFWNTNRDFLYSLHHIVFSTAVSVSFFLHRQAFFPENELRDSNIHAIIARSFQIGRVLYSCVNPTHLQLHLRFRDKKEHMEPEADPERDQRTVFAYQMPLKADERDVYEFFSKAGKVRDVRLIMDRNSRRSKGVGYIEFYDAMSVPMAIALSGHLLLGQPVMVKPSEAEKNLVQSNTSGALGAAGARKIYVGNLHFNITEDLLRQVFEPFGHVELVQLPLDPETGHCRGYGFIQFSQVEYAKAAQSLNGKLDIAGRIIKVSAVTENVGSQESGANATDFDDDDGGGLSMNARSRAILMQKLDRTGTASSIVESLGVPALNGTIQNQPVIPLPSNGLATVPASFSAMLPATIPEPIGEPSECILLKNMFNPSTETDPEFDLDIKEDVQEECTKFGPLKHIYVDKHSSNGSVYLRFESMAAASSCQRAMHMRWFAGRSISATFMRPLDYEAKFRS